MIALPPLDLRRAAIQALIDKGIEPSPANVMKAAAHKSSPIHEWYKSIPAKEWEDCGKLYMGKRIIQLTHIEFNVGGATITARQVECVKVGDEQRYAALQSILDDKALAESYMAAIQSLMEQAVGKMEKYRALMRG